MLRMIVNTSCLIMALSILMPVSAEANDWFIGQRVKGTWIRETGTSQMLVNIGRDGSFLTAASSGAFNTPGGPTGTLLLSAGVGSWTQSGRDSVSLTQLQYAYSDETGELFATLRMTGEILFDPTEHRFGAFTSAAATFKLELFFAGDPIVPGNGIQLGEFENTFNRAP